MIWLIYSGTQVSVVGWKQVCGFSIDFPLCYLRWVPTPTSLSRGLLFEGELIGEPGEEAKRFGPPCPSFTAGALLTISASQLQLDGHQYPTRALLSSSPRPLCFSDYGSLLLLGLGLPHRLAYGLEQPVSEPAPAPPRILFLILAWLLLLLFRGGRLHLGGVGGRHRALWGEEGEGNWGENRGGESLQEERSVRKKREKKGGGDTGVLEVRRWNMGLAGWVEMWRGERKTHLGGRGGGGGWGGRERVLLGEGVASEGGRCPEL